MELRYPDAAPKLLFHEALKRMLNALVNDLVVNTHRRVTEGGIQSLAAIRHAGLRLVAFSEEMEQRRHEAKQYLLQERITPPTWKEITPWRKKLSPDCFNTGAESARITCQPRNTDRQRRRSRVVADYIAGMTDQFIEDQWQHVQTSAKNNVL